MARAAKTQSGKSAKKKPAPRKRKAGKAKRSLFGWIPWLLRWAGRVALALAAIALVLVAFVALFNPPVTPYAFAEARRLGGIEQSWKPLEQIAPVMARSVVAAEDANYCLHWGFDMTAIREALDDGAERGASTITQQVVKNVYLWQGRSWARKAIEAVLTPLVEAVWSKRRIIEVYLNVAEFDEGVFGAEAAAQHYFGVPAKDLSAAQASRLAAILPDPKGRSAAKPSAFVQRRSASIRDGAATIARDGRADCF